MTARVVGAGLLGASLGLALSSLGHRVVLDDVSPLGLSLACGLGAGEVTRPGENDTDVDLVIVATPPDVTAEVVVRELAAYPKAIVTDVASVKSFVIDDILEAAPEGLERFVGSHPMAGKERSGAPNADGDLFKGRPWVVVPTPATSREAHDVVATLAVDVGALPIVMDAAEHDDAVAAVSHVPQLVSSLLASCLAEVPEGALSLAGQGLRDTTRIAKSDPMLWSNILSVNASPVLSHLRGIHDALGSVIAALVECESELYPPAAVATLAATIEAGNAGVARIPGKHGGAQRTYEEIVCYVPDKPGELARLFADIGSGGINIEDVRLEHAAGAKVGLATISVEPTVGEFLATHLENLDWSVVR